MNNQLSEATLDALRKRARDIRLRVLDMVYRAQSGHLGGSFSAVEIITTLYFSEMNIDPKNPRWEGRDRLVPSKGHCAPAIYAALGMKGVIDSDELDDLRQMSCILQGHPCMNKVPGIDISTGSLGHGLSIGVGMALGARLKKQDFNVYALLGDGELDEGQNWEALMSGAKWHLGGLVPIIDRNGVQLDGPTREVMPLGAVESKLAAFGWQFIRCDGHDVGEVLEAVTAAAGSDAPAAVVARTVKGKGVSFMEGQSAWHGKPIGDAEYARAAAELQAGLDGPGVAKSHGDVCMGGV